MSLATQPFAGYQRVARPVEKTGSSECLLPSAPESVLLRRWEGRPNGLEQIDVVGETMAAALERVLKRGNDVGLRVVEVDTDDPIPRLAVELGQDAVLRTYGRRPSPIRSFTVETVGAETVERATLRSDGIVLVTANDDAQCLELAKTLLECALGSRVIVEDDRPRPIGIAR